MVTPTDLPQWMRHLDLSRMHLYPGATEESFARLEGELGIYFPTRYREFMAVTDGIYVTDACNSVELFPIGDGDTDPLKAINRERSTVGQTYSIKRTKPCGNLVDPMLLIGNIEDEDGEVGFLLSELRRGRDDTLPVWHLFEGAYHLIATTFESFIDDISRIQSGQPYLSSISDRESICWKPEPSPRSNASDKTWWKFW